MSNETICPLCGYDDLAPKHIHVISCRGCGADYVRCRAEIWRLKAVADLVPEMLEALEMMMRAQEQLIPGVRYIACEDYAIINDAPIRARAAIAKAKEQKL